MLTRSRNSMSRGRMSLSQSLTCCRRARTLMLRWIYQPLAASDVYDSLSRQASSSQHKHQKPQKQRFASTASFQSPRQQRTHIRSTNSTYHTQHTTPQTSNNMPIGRYTNVGPRLDHSGPEHIEDWRCQIGSNQALRPKQHGPSPATGPFNPSSSSPDSGNDENYATGHDSDTATRASSKTPSVRAGEMDGRASTPQAPCHQAGPRRPVLDRIRRQEVTAPEPNPTTLTSPRRSPRLASQGAKRRIADKAVPTMPTTAWGVEGRKMARIARGKGKGREQ